MKAPTVTIISGLPGSGKSHYIDEHQSEFGFVEADFLKGAILGRGEIPYGRYYPELIVKLRNGFDCCIADVQFCRPDLQQTVEKILGAAVPNVRFRWLAFENDAASCEHNIRHDHAHKGRNLDHRLETLRDLDSKHYKSHSEAEKLKVHRVGG